MKKTYWAFISSLILGFSAHSAEINEIVLDYSGSGYGFIELIGASGESLDNKTLLLVAERYDDPGYNQGIIKEIIPLSGYYFNPVDDYFVIGDSSRFPDEIDYVTGYLDAPGEAVTLFLADEFTGSLNQDLDTDDDGILDVEPWSQLDHAMGYRSLNASSTDLVYTPTFLDYVYFDSLFRPDDTGSLFSRLCYYGGSPGEPNEGPNPPPTDVVSDPEILTITEDAGLNDFIGTLNLVDDDPDNSRIFLINDPANFFSLTSYNGYLRYRNLTGIPLDADVTPSYDIEVVGQDCYGNSILKTFTINVIPGASEAQMVAANETGTKSFHQNSITLTFFQNDDASGFELSVAPLNTGDYNQIAPAASAAAPDGSTIQPDTVSLDVGWETGASDLDGALTYSLSFDISMVSGIGDPDKLLILTRPDEYTPWMPVDTTRSGEMLTATGLSTFGEFAIGSDSSINPLAIQITSFEMEG